MQWTFLTFFFIFEVGSVLCATAQSSAMFIVGRTIAGIGCSGISTGALTIITAILPGKAQAQVLGITQGIGQIGLALGPIIGGAFTTYVSWRWCMLSPLPIFRRTKADVLQASTSICPPELLSASFSYYFASQSRNRRSRHEKC